MDCGQRSRILDHYLEAAVEIEQIELRRGVVTFAIQSHRWEALRRFLQSITTQQLVSVK